jgi:CRISPR/Cas system CMR subunit Cmr4 (Cas7 group RAMP superfamily)
MINTPPELIKKINELLTAHKFNLIHSVINNLDKDNENNRIIYTDGEIKILIETTKFKKR